MLRNPPSPPGKLRSAYSFHAETAALHGIFFLTGLGMVVLGPLLPAISLRWHLQDRSGGFLIGVQFLGSFLGAITLGGDLRKNLSAGCAAIVLGFGLVAAAATTSAGFGFGICGFLIAGFGLGRTITSINLIAGARFGLRRASALSLLNLTWGLGALSGPVAAERMTDLIGIAGAFALLTVVSAIAMASGLLILRHVSSAPGGIPLPTGQPASGWATACFALAFCVYGGIEASLSGWTSSLAARSAGGTLHLGATAATSLWVGMTTGRAVSALLLLRVRERPLLLGALLVSGILIIFLLLPGMSRDLILIAFLLGIALAPVFPSLCSLLLAKALPVSSTGRVMATTALGGAIFPWLVGTLSDRTGALQHGLWVPVALCALLVTLLPALSSSASAIERHR